MPAFVQRIEQAEEPRVLSLQLCKELDACTEIDSTGRNKLKDFLRQTGIQSIQEMDYPLRREYEDYLVHNQKIRQTRRYLLAYDRVKQYAIRKQMETLTDGISAGGK